MGWSEAGAVSGIVPVGFWFLIVGWLVFFSSLLALLERVWVACRWLNLFVHVISRGSAVGWDPLKAIGE